MSYQLNCPNCGKRAVSEFTFRSEYLERPAPDADFSVWADYVYFRENNMGNQTEWWYHRSGCQSWFLAERDTTNNTCLLYTSPSPRDATLSRMPSSA